MSDLISEQEQSASNCKILHGGDFNVTLDPALDCSGGNPSLKESVKFLEDIMMENDLVDIWRIRNRTIKILLGDRKTQLFKDV